jgi:hypothetical protein
MARSMTAEKTATTFTGYQMLTDVNVRTASATAPRATTAMLAVQPTLTRRLREPDTDRNCIEHPEVRPNDGIAPLATKPRRPWTAMRVVAGRSGRSHRRLTTVRPRGTGRHNSQNVARPGSAVSTPAISSTSAQKTPAPIPHTTFILDQYVQRQRTRADRAPFWGRSIRAHAAAAWCHRRHRR